MCQNKPLSFRFGCWIFILLMRKVTKTDCNTRSEVTAVNGRNHVVKKPLDVACSRSQEKVREGQTLKYCKLSLVGHTG